MMTRHIKMVEAETQRCLDLFNAQSDKESSVTIYSSLRRNILYDVCVRIRHKLSNQYIAKINGGSTITIKRPYNFLSS